MSSSLTALEAYEEHCRARLAAELKGAFIMLKTTGHDVDRARHEDGLLSGLSSLYGALVKKGLSQLDDETVILLHVALRFLAKWIVGKHHCKLSN